MMPGSRPVLPPTSHAGASASAVEMARRMRLEWLERLMRANSGMAIALDALADQLHTEAEGSTARKLAAQAVLAGLELALSRDAIGLHVPPTLACLRDLAEGAETALHSLREARDHGAAEMLATALDASREELRAVALMLVELKA